MIVMHSVADLFSFRQKVRYILPQTDRWALRKFMVDNGKCFFIKNTSSGIDVILSVFRPVLTGASENQNIRFQIPADDILR